MASFPAKSFQTKNGKTFIIRSADVDDAEALLHLAKTIMGETPFVVTEPDEFDMPVEKERDWVVTHRDHPGKIVLVAEMDHELIGICNFACASRRRMAHQGTLGISLLKAWHNQGIGTVMMQCLIDWANAAPGVERLGLAVFVKNEPAIHLYRKLGFQEEGYRPRILKLADGTYEDDILMYRFVKPIH